MKIEIGGMFSTMLTIMFIGLKLTNQIDWSWWFVLMPMWLPLTLIILFVMVMGFLNE